MKSNIETIMGITPKEYASQGNAILGIRDSGKSYTGTAIAENLLDAGIPFVAFDPIGVWRYLKIGRKEFGAGYPIVVAGDNGDLDLTPESAKHMVRLAMKENIPLILDLYSMKLSKADWKRIVEESIRILLYENKGCGLRHIFIEEAAEFCPQRVGPDQGRVYAEIEKLARMGGNASLGYTLINQRAEEVNKAVLELCDCLILHRQKGRHSLTALGKWLDVADAGNSRAIVKSLPTLSQGECWIWKQGSQNPDQIKVWQKKTVHPDRRNPLITTKGIPADVTRFVETLKHALAKQKEENPQTTVPTDRRAREVSIDNSMVAGLQAEISRLSVSLSSERSKAAKLQDVINRLKKQLQPEYDALKTLFSDLEGESSSPSAEWSVWLEKLNGKNREMLQVLVDNRRLTRQQLGFKIGMSSNSGSFNTYLSRLRSLKLVVRDGEYLTLNDPAQR